jgi:hypothetical protein
MKKIFSILIYMLISLSSFANYSSNGFTVTNKSLDWDKTIRADKCRGVVPYPELHNADEELSARINDEIHDFVELYAICNKDDKDHFTSDFEVPTSGSNKIFSVLWYTKENNKLYQIDTLNFDLENGSLVAVDSILDIKNKNVLDQLIKMSNKHLNKNCSCEKFIDKIEKSDIQLYIKNNEWYIIFNPKCFSGEVVELKIPQTFLMGK